MNSKHIGGDYNFAWPTAEIAVMGPESACNIIFRKEISTSDNQRKRRQSWFKIIRIDFQIHILLHSKGYIDAVIEPKETRQRLISALKAIRRKREVLPRRKHGNIPV